MSRTTLANIACLLGYTIFGFSFLFSKLALDLASPFQLLSARFLLAFGVLNLILLSGKVKVRLKGKPVKLLLLLGLLQPVVYFICENYGISMSSAAFSGVMLGTIPVIGLVIGRVFLKEGCGPFQVICAIVSVFGVALTSVGGGGAVSPLGTVLLLVSAAASAGFTALSRRLSQDFTPFERTYVMFALGSVVFSALALLEHRSDPSALLLPFAQPQFWISLLYLSLASSICAFLLLNFAMGHVSVGRSSAFSNFTTVVSALAGVLILGDTFSAPQALGVVVIILSVFGVSVSGHFPRRRLE